MISDRLLEPLYCLAVSAKRYALFNKTADGKIIIRKASGHGLGHLLAPYDDPDRSDRIKRIGVELWEEDLWRETIKSTLDGHPDQVQFDHIAGFERPACSRYAATTPTLLNWFREYNKGRPYAKSVRPFNFLLSLQAKSVVQSAAEDPYTAAGRRSERQIPRPAAPYDKDVLQAAAKAFDRKTGQPIPMDRLATLGRSLVRYHLHPEGKFWGGDYDQRGQLSRRHVSAETIQPIGKEADSLEEREFVGRDDAEIKYNLSPDDRAKLILAIKRAKPEFGLKQLSAAAKVSHHRVKAVICGKSVSDHILNALGNAANALERKAQNKKLTEAALLRKLKKLVAEKGHKAVADYFCINPSNLSKLLKGTRHISVTLRNKMEKINQATNNAAFIFPELGKLN